MGGGLNRTALYDSHISAGAKMVDFHGFELPIWYSSIQEEHLQTRSSAGMFDVSHMDQVKDPMAQHHGPTDALMPGGDR